jgi:hypothetical protein
MVVKGRAPVYCELTQAIDQGMYGSVVVSYKLLVFLVDDL